MNVLRCQGIFFPLPVANQWAAGAARRVHGTGIKLHSNRHTVRANQSYLPIFRLPVFVVFHGHIFLSSCLPILLVSHGPIFLSSYLPTFLVSHDPIFLSSYLPIFLVSHGPIFLSSYLPIFPGPMAYVLFVMLWFPSVGSSWLWLKCVRSLISKAIPVACWRHDVHGCFAVLIVTQICFQKASLLNWTRMTTVLTTAQHQRRLLQLLLLLPLLRVHLPPGCWRTLNFSWLPKGSLNALQLPALPLLAGRCDSASGKLLNGSSTEQRSKSVNCGSSSPSTKHTRLWSFERKAATWSWSEVLISLSGEHVVGLLWGRLRSGLATWTYVATRCGDGRSLLQPRCFATRNVGTRNANRRCFVACISSFQAFSQGEIANRVGLRIIVTAASVINYANT